ncbi:hypothetical protein A1O3_01888 [Capronia epimyces CBS 606.96]|uniref:tRNA/rRNA methyltransferase SpoU type domain-containing protein n=1 Tax=Capronia epimyces CBS 606.96 TaxID=1182542 RepID=W9Z2T0_9EURO|nr:uncharacterized protein A1O3_01888 [Capronia epimyces CBS 606.96]EXJ88824.1 hypothetical protein A1O3_01888 [Capronia epimyces CBS 606.96]
MQAFGGIVPRGSSSLKALGYIQPARYISLTGAIEKGHREAQHSASRHEARYRAVRDEDRDRTQAQGLAGPALKVHRGASDRWDQPDGQRWTLTRRTSHRQPDERPAHSEARAPVSLPYTTASSEFIYGTFSVLSALKARRRKLYKLYRLRSPTHTSNRDSDKPARTKANTGTDRFEGSWDHIQAQEDIYNLAKRAGVEVKDVWGPEWNRILSKAATGRPHNGLVLEASPLPKLPVTGLSPLNSSSDAILATVGWASQEDQEVNRAFENRGNVATIPSVRPSHRYPFILLLDCITDTGNFGAIVRSAWFLGVDAILILDHGTAPISSNSLKASAGALEYMPILHVKNERSFVKISRENGWRFFGADAPDSERPLLNHYAKGKNVRTLGFEGALLRHPCVLVLGNEGTGIRDFMKSLVDGVVGIPNARPQIGDIDSLNVSVAAALMTQRFFDSAPAPSGPE